MIRFESKHFLGKYKFTAFRKETAKIIASQTIILFIGSRVLLP